MDDDLDPLSREQLVAEAHELWQAIRQHTFRGGVAYDQTPVTDAVRDVRVPDVSRRWLSLGRRGR